MPLAGWLVGLGARRIGCGSGAALEYLGYAAFTLARAQPVHFGGNELTIISNEHWCNYSLLFLPFLEAYVCWPLILFFTSSSFSLMQLLSPSLQQMPT